MSTPTPTMLSNFSVPLKVLGNASFTLTPPTSNSSGTFSYASSKTSVATVAGNTVTIVGAGFTTITATQAAHGGFTSASITAGFSVLIQSPLVNDFEPNTSNPTLPENSGVSVSGKFYDSKQDVSFDVNLFFQSSESYTMDVTNYKVTIDSLSQDSESVREDYTFVTESIPDSIGKRVVGNIIKSDISKLDTNKRGFSFVDLQIYAIKHSATIVQTNNDGDNTVTPVIPPTTFRYVYNYTQIFRYYETPVEFSDFSFNDNAGLGDNLEVTGLYLDHGDNLPVDPTEPETVKFTFNVIDENNSDADLYFESEHTFSSNGTYTIQLPPSENPQGFELGNAYNITAQGQWTLGYDISKTSSQSLNLLSRPVITNIEVLELDVDTDDDIMKITLDELSASGSIPAPDKVWFEFRDPSGNLVARAGGDPATTGLGITIPSTDIVLLKLSQIDVISGGGLLNDVNYSVIAKIKYDTLSPPVFRDSDPYEPVNFALTEPTISSIVENSLYIRDTTANIATITVTHEAYKLYAPHETDGIEFVFYDDVTEVARTSRYTFVNTLTASTSTLYPIKLSEITPTNGVYLTHGVTYTVKAAVKVTDHANNTSYVVSSESSTVTFDLTEPDISSIVVNSLYLVDPSGNILPSDDIATINVTREAYKLYAPYATDGIEFVFYDDDTEVARTSDYTFVNTSVAGSQPYPIKLSEITPTNGVYLTNGVTYTVKAAVKVTNHANNTSYVVSSESREVTFDHVRPEIESITPYDVQNDGGSDGVFDPSSNDVDSASQIVATIVLADASYNLYAPNVIDGILFIFYDISNNQVATTSPYDFSNDGSNLYNIQLDEITASTLLTNGTPYKVKAQVTLVDHSDDEELRLSAAFTDVTFTQNIAPVISLTTSNTWELVTNNDPESYRTNFLASPVIGISGNFSKNAQFGSVYADYADYSKDLDTTSTKFKLEYRVLVLDSSSNVLTDASGNAIDLSGNAIPWTTVKKAKLVLQGSLDPAETLEGAAERARSTGGSLSSVSSGEYANIPGTGLGTDQGDIVFYIQQQQVSGVNAFDETHQVEVRVSVIDRTSPALWGGVTTSTYTVSDPVHVIKKIDVYDFTTGESTEPWNSVDGDDNLLINIPVSWNSEYSHSVEVSYKYSAGASYGTATEFLKADNPLEVSFVVDPAQGTTLYYRVRYVVDNPNLGETATTDGIFTEKDVDNKFFPESSDYVVSNTSYMTFNDDGESSITFDLSFNIDPANRLDGVNVYFTSTDSGIPTVRIGSYTTDQTGEDITLLLTSGGNLQYMNDAGAIVDSVVPWADYDSATISFEAFRDARVNSTDASYNPVSSDSDPDESGFYVESGSQSTFGTPPNSNSNPILNIPVLTTPGGIILSGGVINIDPSSNHYISWIADTDEAYTYNLEMFKDDGTDAIQSKTGLTTPSQVLNIDLNATAKYTVNIRKVFQGEVSEPTVIVFHTIDIDTSDMDVSVINPSNLTSVSLSWNDLDISGNSVTSSGYEASSFANNIYTQYIKYRIGSSGSYARLDTDPSANLVEESSMSYTLPSAAVPGDLLQFIMYVEAQVKYTVDGEPSSTKSTPYPVPFSPQTPTTASQYLVSSIPSVDVLPGSDDVNIVPVLVQGSSNPTLLLNLNANGLEEEGFISVVVILTQDGTDAKPEGEQALLIFPDNNTNHPFSFPNTVVAGGGVLAGGDSATSAPRNELQSASSLSTHNNNYTLTIGTVETIETVTTTGGEVGRYGLSTLEMPSTANSGFVSGSPVNYMVILTTRRGTDIGVGEFTYEALPSVQDVEIVTIDGQYFVVFNITNA